MGSKCSRSKERLNSGKNIKVPCRAKELHASPELLQQMALDQHTHQDMEMQVMELREQLEMAVAQISHLESAKQASRRDRMAEISSLRKQLRARSEEVDALRSLNEGGSRGNAELQMALAAIDDSLEVTRAH